MRAAALVVAAGSGERLGASGPKAFVILGGIPLLEHSLRTLASVTSDVVVAVPPAYAYDAPEGVRVVPGGSTRSESVRNALDAVPGDVDAVIVHDAARPFAGVDLFARSLAALDDADAAIAAAPVTDTVKQAATDRTITATLDRSTLWAVQTPQTFRYAALRGALDQPDDVLARATDDASLVEARGGRVVVVPSDASNFKITTPFDLRMAELLLRAD